MPIRLWTAMLRHPSRAARADPTARSISAAPPTATIAWRSPVVGSWWSYVPPDPVATRSSPMMEPRSARPTMIAAAVA